MLTFASRMFCQKASMSWASGMRAPNPMTAMGSNGPCSIHSQGLPSAVVNVMGTPQFMMLSGTIVME